MKSARFVSQQEGFTLVEVLLGAGIMVVLFAAITAMMQMSLRTVGQSRTKATGQQLLQEKIETIRNMPYVDVGTVGGVPSGNIEQEEVLQINGGNYTVTTNVTYVDDPFDGVSPVDLLPTDYKRVRVTINWDGVFSLREPLVMMTDVASKGLESDEGGGKLVIQVLNSSGLPVQSADVHVEADAISPPVDLDTLTDADGLVELPGVQECIECYKISVTDDGYTTDRTYGAEEVANPNKPHATVLEGDVTQISFVIDTTTRMLINTVKGASGGYQPYDYLPVKIQGTKEIGRNEFDEPVYKVDTQITTDGQGKFWYENLEWDSYTLSLPSGGGLDVVGYWPPQPFPVVPYYEKNTYLVIGNNSDESLMVRVTDNEGSPLENVLVELENVAESLSQQKLTAATTLPDRGQVFFENLPETLEPYEIALSLLGYDEASTSATVSGDVVEQFILNPSE